MKFTGKNHYVIVGWTSKTVNLIEEFLAANKKAEIVLIDRLLRTPLTHRQVHYIQGDATDEEILLKANVLEAKTVSVLSNESLSHGDADARTLMIATTIEGLSKQRDKSVYTIVEVMKENNIKKFKHAKVDEYVTSSDTVAHIMAQAAIHNGSSEFFRELASKESGENLYEIQAKSHWITYKDAMLELLEHEAILLWDKDRKAINGILNEKIPPQSTLFFMSTNESYKKIVQGEKEKKNVTNIQKDINKTLAKSID